MPNRGPRPNKLTLVSLMAVMYFTVSGGPYGLEGMVSGVGPKATLALLLLVPLLYSLPELLIVGELNSLLPVEGGYYVWVRQAFGPLMGFWNGWLSWVYSLVDMALYPVLFIQYLRFFVPDLGRLGEWVLCLIMIWGAAWLNIRGVRSVGWASRGFGVAVVAPFAALCALSVAHWLSGSASHAAGFAHSHGTPGPFGMALGLAISQAIWNYSGWDNTSTIAGEVESPSRSYPRALFWTLPIVTGIYLLSVLPALAVTDWRTWTDGSWPAIGKSVAGYWLGAWLSMAGMVSALGLFNGLLLVYSRIPLVVSQDGLLPSVLARTDERGTPRNAIIASAVAYSCFALLSFGELLTSDVFLYTAALAMEFAALVKLRRVLTAQPGAFRLPVNTTVLVLLASIPIVVLLAGVGYEIMSPDVGVSGIVVATVVGLFGPPLYGILVRQRRRRAAA